MKTLPLPETVLLVGGFFFVALNTPLRAQPGSLDPTFNPMIPWQPGSQVSALAVQTDDRLVVGGNFQSALLRLLTNGSVDPGFQQRNPEGSDVFSWVTSLAVKGGDQVVAGGSFSGTGTYGVARFNSAGTRDTSYDPATDPNPFAVRQSDGKTLIVDGGLRIKRLNPDGSPDPSFSSIQLGGGGPTPMFDSSNITAIAVQPNDKIIVATFFSRWIGTQGRVLRLESDGTLDNGFTPATATIAPIFAVTIQQDGGQFSTVNGVSRIGLARLIGDNPAEKPRIISQPVDRIAPFGGRVVFSVAVSSFEVPTFQWQLNGANIPGATNRVLELTSVQSDQAGEYKVVVSNSIGSVESAVARLVVLAAKCPAPSFDARRPFDAGPNPDSLAVGDFNADGKPDVAVANSTTGIVSVLLGKGDGTFQARTAYLAGPNPGSIAIVDFNGDGKADLGVAHLFSNSVSVLLGKGDGTFEEAVNSNLGAGSLTTSMAVGDFNGDGKPDAAFALFGSSSVLVVLGRGDGTFQDAVYYGTGAIPAGGFPPGAVMGKWSVATGDFNGDSRPDLIVTNPGKIDDPQRGGSVRGSVSVLPGNGDGSFRAPLNYPLEAPPNSLSMPYSVAVGDFNNDGKTDFALAIASYTFQHFAPVITFAGVSVLLGNGDGTFQKAANYTAGASPIDLEVGDFNGDGVPDLAVANQGSDPDASVSVLLGSGDGTFQPAVNFGAGARSRFVAVGDFNGDLQPDLAVLSESSSVLLSTCDPAGAGLAVARKLDTVILSWPVSSTGFVCESTTSLSLTNWQPAVEALTTNDGRLEVTAPLNQSQRFFRLRKL